MTDEMTHLDDAGSVRMVDVGEKAPTARRAVAEATVRMHDSTRDRLFAGVVRTTILSGLFVLTRQVFTHDR